MQEDPIIKKVTILLLILSSVTFWTCSSKSSKQVKVFDTAKWGATDSAVFQFEVQDVEQHYTLEWDFIHDVSYPNSNLFIFARFSDGENPEQVDTLEYQVAYSDGVFIGSGGKQKTVRMVYAEHIKFNKKGKHSLTVQHGMRTDSLKGVHELRFYLTKRDN